jgi:hypothetical protein
VKTKIKRRDAGEMRILAIILIANSTELLAAAVRGSTQADIDAAIEHAVDRFVNQRDPAAVAVAQGIQHARDRILHREALMLCAVLMINFYIYR